MKKLLLLFGFEELPTLLAVEAAVSPFGAEVAPVSKGSYNRPLGALAGLDTAKPQPVQPYMGGPLGGRMILLCGLDQEVGGILRALGQAGVSRECYKAVLTEHNRNWDAVTLFAELQKERRAMEGGAPGPGH